MAVDVAQPTPTRTSLEGVRQRGVCDERVFGEKEIRAPQRIQRTPRVLCIDDDPEICRSLELRLRNYDVDVMLAYFGTQGYWEAITDHPDVILMDIAMPNGDGRFVLQSLRSNQQTESIPVIVLTGMRDPDLKREMLALGADAYLTKPTRFTDLVSEMSRFVDLTPSIDSSGDDASA